MIAVLAFWILQDWTELPAKIEQVGDDVYITFAPIALSGLRVNRDVRKVQVYGVEGEADCEAGGGLLRFRQKSEIAEVVLFGCAAKGLKLDVLKVEAKRVPPIVKEGDLSEIGEFKPTFYWVLLEEKFDGPCDTPLLGDDGKELGRFPKDFVRQAKIEGTAKLRDGRVINVAGKGFKFVDAPNGLGAGGYHLIPYRSIAVDRSEIKLGTKLFVREAVGMKLPDGSVHDGIFFAHDVGGGIKGKRIDLFTGQGRNQEVFEKAGIRNMKAVKVYTLKG